MGRKGLEDMKRPTDEWRHYDLAFTFGVSLILSMILGYFGGRVVDRYLGLDPYGSLVGILLGIVAAFRSLLRDLQRVPQRGEPFQIEKKFLKTNDDEDEVDEDQEDQEQEREEGKTEDH
ncbi:MAG: AtpZ/AtpI family protein [Firmicutes bacterium]|nr:AtpZ/AtpI family protein [Bacillota bacterium]